MSSLVLRVPADWTLTCSSDEVKVLQAPMLTNTPYYSIITTDSTSDTMTTAAAPPAADTSVQYTKKKTNK